MGGGLGTTKKENNEEPNAAIQREMVWLRPWDTSCRGFGEKLVGLKDILGSAVIGHGDLFTGYLVPGPQLDPVQRNQRLDQVVSAFVSSSDSVALGCASGRA